jgi:hypothetical protein
MIRDLDDTIKTFLKARAPRGSLLEQVNIGFDLPDAAWRNKLSKLTLNCYLYDIRENREMRTAEPRLVKSADGKTAKRVPAPVRVDCAYCITAWSVSQQEPVFEEHRLLSQVLSLFLRHPTLPREQLVGKLATQIPPYPTLLAAQEGVKNQAEFWHALDQKLKPSLNYVVTLAMIPEQDEVMTAVPANVKIKVDQ